MSVTSIIIIYWLFFKKDTYVNFKLKNFNFKKDIIIDIFRVGFPASIQQLSMSFTMIIINLIILNLANAGDQGITVYTIGWRLVMVAILPLLGLATAVITVTGAAYGAHDYNKLNTGFNFALKFGLILEIIIALTIFILAPYITLIFTTGPGLIDLRNEIEQFIRISCFFYPGAAFGIIASSTFQGTGKGVYALSATLLRTVILTPIFASIFCCIIALNLNGIWWGIVAANLIGSFVSFIWVKLYIMKLNNY